MKKTDYHDVREKPYVKPRPGNRSRPRILSSQNKMKTWKTIETWGFQKTLSKISEVFLKRSNALQRTTKNKRFLKRMFPLSMNEKFMVKKEGPLPAEVDHIAGGDRTRKAFW